MLAATITVTTTKTSLYNLLRDAATDAAGPGANVRYQRPQEGFSLVQFQAPAATTNPVFIGDQNVSATNQGIVIPATTAPSVLFPFGHDAADLNTRTMFLVSTGGTQTLNVILK